MTGAVAGGMPFSKHSSSTSAARLCRPAKYSISTLVSTSGPTRALLAHVGQAAFPLQRASRAAQRAQALDAHQFLECALNDRALRSLAGQAECRVDQPFVDIDIREHVQNLPRFCTSRIVACGKRPGNWGKR